MAGTDARLKQQLLSRREFCGMLLALPAANHLLSAVRAGLVVSGSEILLRTGNTELRFTKKNNAWALDAVSARGMHVFSPLSRRDSFWLGGGEAHAHTVLEQTSSRYKIRFSALDQSENHSWISYSVDTTSALPRVAIEISGDDSPVCAFRTAVAAEGQHGAWATRGETASDEEEREVFFDASGPVVFGHSCAGSLDAAYVVQAEVLDNIDPRGRSMQPSETYFKSGRINAGNGKYCGYWKIRFGSKQPKRFHVIFDRDLGGRLNNVCEKYYAGIVDSQVDLASIPSAYDPYLALDRMPLRLSCPESLVPGYGWHMEEYTVHGHPSSYPFGHDCGIQTAALLNYEGLATARDWERHFGSYVLSKLPLWGERDGEGYFVRRPGGWTRWASTSDYRERFPFSEGGSWGTSEHIYSIACESGDRELKSCALELMKHDVLVKLDLEKMYFPPRWNPITGKQQDHGDDWAITACLGYCSEVSSEILYHEIGDRTYLEIADRITDWLRDIWGPERRMNYLYPGVNTFHCWMGWLPNALIHRYERSGDKLFLDIAKDLAWIMILTSCTTAHRDAAGLPLTGVTCVGVRGCIDYDCTPNLCQEKDQTFLQMMGLILKHARGSAYAKYLALQKLVLPRDRWEQAFGIQEQRDVNLRTNYDNFPRGMTNLAFALNRTSDSQIAVFEKLVSERNLLIRERRDMAIANATSSTRNTRLQLRFLEAGTYSVFLDDVEMGVHSAAELEGGVDVIVEANSMRTLRVSAVSHLPAHSTVIDFDSSITYLSDLPELAAQRGVGLERPVYVKDRDFLGKPISLQGVAHAKGLGIAANTVVLYDLGGGYRTLSALAGIGEDLASLGRKPSINITIFCDGICRFDSGVLASDTPVQPVDIDVRKTKTLTIRVSSGWTDDGDLSNDFGVLADARLLGRHRPS